MHGDCRDGSVFYRYPDGSEYYRRKNGKITFRPSEDPPEKPEREDLTAAPTVTPAPTMVDRRRRPWYDWPPQLNISVKADGSSVMIGDASGSTVTFEPVGPNIAVDPVPARNGSAPPLLTRVGLSSRLPFCRSTSLGRVQPDESLSQASCGATFGAQEWVKRRALVDIVSRGQD